MHFSAVYLFLHIPLSPSSLLENSRPSYLSPLVPSPSSIPLKLLTIQRRQNSVRRGGAEKRAGPLLLVGGTDSSFGGVESSIGVLSTTFVFFFVPF